MSHRLLIALLCLLLPALTGCPQPADDDDAVDDDDAADDDDAVPSTCDNDDTFEPNDTAATAAAISLGATESLFSCPDNDDFFTFTTTEEGAATVLLEFLDDSGDVDADLFEGNDLLDSARSSGDNETLTFQSPAGGSTYTLQVFLNETFDDATPGNEYSIQIDVETPKVCPNDDQFEDNDDRDHAAPMEPGLHFDLKICTFDEDYYALDVFEGDVVQVDVFFVDDEGDIDVHFLDPDFISQALGNSSSDDESMGPIDIDETGTWYIEVEMFNDPDGDGGNTYDLDVVVGVDGR